MIQPLLSRSWRYSFTSAWSGLGMDMYVFWTGVGSLSVMCMFSVGILPISFSSYANASHSSCKISLTAPLWCSDRCSMSTGGCHFGLCVSPGLMFSPSLCIPVVMLTAEQVAWLVEVETEASGWSGESVAAYTAFTLKVSRWPRVVCWSSTMG